MTKQDFLTEFNIPTADVATNTNARDVIGNKTDTTAGDSLVSLNKIIDADIGDASASTLGSVYEILGNPATTITAQITDVKTQLGTAGAGLTAIPDMALNSTVAKEATVSALNNLSAAQVNAEVDTALNTIVPVSPTAGSVNDILSKVAGGNTFDKSTDSLEALADTLAILSSRQTQILEKTLDLSQDANTYDITTASGDVFIEDFVIYVATAGATFDSVSIQTNDTTAYSLMTSEEGAVGSLTAGLNYNTATKGKSIRLTSGKKLQYTIAGSTGTGSIKLELKWRPISAGASIS